MERRSRKFVAFISSGLERHRDSVTGPQTLEKQESRLQDPSFFFDFPGE